MFSLKYVKPEPIQMKEHPELTETWIRDRILEDPINRDVANYSKVVDCRLHCVTCRT
jgi:hypothetical protein